MNIWLTIRVAWKNIIGNRLRSGLTILGLVIGIVSVILMVGLVNGATQSITEEMSSMGADLVSVYLYDDSDALSNEELTGIKKLDKVRGVTPYLDGLDASLSKNGKKASGVSLVAAGGEYATIMGYDMKHGRDLSKIDVDHYTKCIIIGSKLAKKFWNKGNPCGDTIKVNGDDYTVVGVMASVGSSMGTDVDSSAIMPITTASYLGQSTSITQFYVQAETDEDANDVCTAVKAYLTGSKGISSDNCEAQTQQMIQDSMNEVTQTLTMLLGGIASISLLVGGIGVMNVMLVSVTERTREIGIRKSLGAKRKDILIQFLVESMVLSLMGGIIGVILGLLFGKAATVFGASFAPGIGMILLSFGVSIGVGLVFGIMPAYRAAKLRPVEALRYE